LIVTILQARMSSKRLPGKVLKPILGRSMMSLQIERLQRCELSDVLVVATSDLREDDEIAHLCVSMQVPCFRGSLDDVLDRYYRCAELHEADHLIRLTGDCPLIDPLLVDDLIRFYLSNGYDYSSNCRPPTLPDGLDAEVMSFSALSAAWREATDLYDREHVVPFIIRNPSRFNLGNLTYNPNLSNLRWTVDYPRDLLFVEKVYEYLYPTKPEFGFRDVLNLLSERSELTDLNSGFMRNSRI